MMDDKIEFRCTAATRARVAQRLQELRAKTLSEAARKLVETALDGLEAPWRASPALSEVCIHLDRTASALQRCTLDGSRPDDLLAELTSTLARVKALIDGKPDQRSTPGRRGRGRLG